MVYQYSVNEIITFEEPLRIHGCDAMLVFLKGTRVTKCCIYNQFSVAFILHSIKAYFFTCSYFRILYSVLHLKDSSTSIRVKLDQLHDSERLHSSNNKLSFSDHVTSFPATMTQ